MCMCQRLYCLGLYAGMAVMALIGLVLAVKNRLLGDDCDRTCGCCGDFFGVDHRCNMEAHVGYLVGVGRKIDL